MMTMTQIQDIRYLSVYKDLSKRAIARETGYDFRTVKKYVDKEDFNETRVKRRGRPSVLDPVKHIIDQWLEEDRLRHPKQRHTAKRVYDRLKSEHADIFVGCERTVRNYVAGKKKEIYGEKEGALPLEHPPGEAQADFGEVYVLEQGVRIKCWELVLSFPHSNGALVQLFKGQNQECLFAGLKAMFEYMDMVPLVIWFDNLSAAVAGIHGYERILTDAFQRFAMHYGFEPRFCNPASGHEKGHVENKVGYGRRNFFVPEPEIGNIDDFNQRLFAAAENDMQRPHYLKKLDIARLFEEDKRAMRSLPKIPFEIGKWQKCKCNNYGKIKFEGNIYSVSPGMAGREIWIKAGAHEIEILNEDYRVIVKHPRLYGSGQESMQWHPYLATLAKRPRALKYTGFFREMPESWQAYFNGLDLIEQKQSLKVLVRILGESDMETATRSLEASLKSGTTNAEGLLFSYLRMHQSTEPEFIAGVKDPPGYRPDLTVYDQLMKAGGSC